MGASNMQEMPEAEAGNDVTAKPLIECILNQPTVREAALIGIITQLSERHRACDCLGCRIRYFTERHADVFTRDDAMATVRVTTCDVCKKQIEGFAWHITIQPPPPVGKFKGDEQHMFDLCGTCAGFPVTAQKVQTWTQRLSAWWHSAPDKRK